VRVWEDERGSKRLVAYVALSGERAPSAAELRGHLRGKLPEYMTPWAFVTLEQMPLTVNGKIDRRALPRPEPGDEGNEYVGPRTPVEEVLCGVWAKALRIEQVGVRDNFFELGGHSLLAVQVVTRIRQVLGRELPVRALFESPTVPTLARQLSSAVRAEERPMVCADRTQALPLSWAQQRLWFIDQLEGGGAAYHVPAAVRLHGVLDQEALQGALDTLLERHEVLRTVFRSVEGQPVQIITETKRFALQVIDLSVQGAAEREQEINEQTRQEASAQFELSTGPLIRGRLLRVKEDEHVLLVTMHHIVSDGWSRAILIREVGTLYAAYREGRANPLSPLPIQYADYALWQRQWLQGEALREQLEYWKQQLLGAPALLELPTDRPRPRIQSYRGASVPIVLDRELSRQIGSLARRHDATVFMTLYAGLAILLSRLSGQQDIVVGTPVANRQRLEIEGLIGFFANTLALRVQLADELTIAEVLARVKALTLQGYAHQDVPFEKLVEDLQPERSLSHTPLFQVMFQLQSGAVQAWELAGLTQSPVRIAVETTKFDLEFHLRERGDSVGGVIAYNVELFDGDTIRGLARHFERLLESIVANPEERVSELPLLSEEEREQLLHEWNDTATEYPAQCIHELFEEQVERAPEAIAVAYGEQRLSYEELNRRANQLGHYLRSKGVGAEVLVGICVEGTGFPSGGSGSGFDDITVWDIWTLGTNNVPAPPPAPRRAGARTGRGRRRCRGGAASPGARPGGRGSPGPLGSGSVRRRCTPPPGAPGRRRAAGGRPGRPAGRRGRAGC